MNYFLIVASIFGILGFIFSLIALMNVIIIRVGFKIIEDIIKEKMESS